MYVASFFLPDKNTCYLSYLLIFAAKQTTHTMFKQHPKGLPFLFFTEMWERFGYYLMIGIFAFYLKDVKQGFGFDEAQASNLYGTFIALVFLTPFIGGIVADKWLGYRKSIIMGGLMMGLGYIGMSIHNETALYTSMALVIFGNGFFKPNISTILGNIYSEEQYKIQKDSGYNIFYMGINIGAFICNFFGAAMYNMYGWGAAFIMAGVGMFIGIIVFLIGTRHYIHADIPKSTGGSMSEEDKKTWISFGGTIVVALLFAGLALYKEDIWVKDKVTDAFLLACLPVIAFYAYIYFSAPAHEKRPLSALMVIFIVTIPFWAVFKQNGTALNTWADRYTDRQVTGGTETFFGALKITKELTGKMDSVPKYDAQFRQEKHGKNKINTWGKDSYFNNVPVSEQPQGENDKISVWSPNLSQSINPGWVVLLTPLVVGFFAWMRKKGKEPTTPTKIALGLLISALSGLCMVGAVYVSNNGAEKSSILWLLGTYGVITVGELCLSPMGLALVSKLSPTRITAIMMGGWFLSTSIGNKLSGIMASMWDTYDHKAEFFYLNIGFLLGATALMFLLLRWLNVIFREYVEK